ncbi:hypothetical protein SELMODRAFT_407173 [Selaginella moellendorffii]|uniref:Uncharacterized protein n=1 Tax=Selaginella moellendorffii TaxID=88036 RepID=D8R451_SELML|nr:hypothetical protein SELMODRAFT_407173 [Selaginella moellendorffii]
MCYEYGTFESLPIEISSLDHGKHVNPPSCHIERQAIPFGISFSRSQTAIEALLLSWEQQRLQFSDSKNLPLVPLVHFDSLEGESMQELEDYAIQKAEETTAATYKALNLAEEITSIMFHQISHTHDTVVDIDHELS